MPNFVQRLANISSGSQTLVCIGLDPNPELMPITDVVAFNKSIIDATHDLVCAYKPNLAYYEARGSTGIRQFEATITHIRDVAPEVVIIADAKRGDFPPTNVQYARALFETWGVDAATVNSFLGGDSMEPFLEYEDKASFVLCRTSNPGAAEFQDITMQVNGKSMPYYQLIAHRANSWNIRGNVGLVAGATYPTQLAEIRKICPELPLLVPGVGAQSGSLQQAVQTSINSEGRNSLIASSRSIIYASPNSNFAEAARTATMNLREEINAVLENAGFEW